MTQLLHCEVIVYYFVGLLNMATNKPQDKFVKTALRLPKELHTQVHESARLNGRSFNSEIVQRLTESVNRPRSSEANTYEMVLVQKLNLETSREFLQKEVDDPRTEDSLKPELKIRITGFDRAIQKLEKLLKDIRNINVEASRVISALYPD